MEIQRLVPGDPQWNRALATIQHDVYHVPEYVEFAAQRDGRTPMGFLAEDQGCRAFVPLLVGNVPREMGGGPGVFDAVSPRGYSGPVFALADRARAPEFQRAFTRDLLADLASLGVIAAFVRLHPLYPASRGVLAETGRVVHQGSSWSLDLTKSRDDMRRAMRENHRRDIRRAVADGYIAREDVAWDHIDDFASAHRALMQSIGASPHWMLPREYFASLHRGLGARARLVVVEKDGAFAAGAIVTRTGGIAEYHLAATASSHVHASPSKLLIDHIAGWAKGLGDSVLHLAGSPTSGDSVSRFKEGFAPTRHDVLTWRAIVDDRQYEAVVVRSHRLASAAADHFPLYRADTPPALWAPQVA